MAKRRLTILQINDTHGYLEPHPELFHGAGEVPEVRTAGGFARIATLFARARAENPGGTLAFDNGDTFHGTYPAVASRGEALVPVLNALGLDAMTAHWDFAYGPEQLGRLVGRLAHPLLALNCYREDTDERPYPPSRVLARGGVRVGVVGLAATIVDKTMPPHFSTGLRFTLGRQELPGEIRRLRDEEGVEVVVVLSHLGFPQDVKLAREVPGIDVLLSGHTHNRLYAPVRSGDALLIQSGCHGSFVGRLDLEVGEGGMIGDARHELIPVDETIVPDPVVEALVAEALGPYREQMDAVVGETGTLLSRDEMFGTTMDDLLLAAVAEAAGAPVAFSNGWRYGAPVPRGPVTLGDLWNVVPPNPPVSLVEMTGAEMWDMLEENLERTFAADPYEQMGGYVKRCRGVRVYAKLENPPGLRIQQFFVGDRPLNRHASYTVAFVTNQGVPAKYGRDRRDLPVRAVEALRHYLARHSPVTVDEPPGVVIV